MCCLLGPVQYTVTIRLLIIVLLTCGFQNIVLLAATNDSTPKKDDSKVKCDSIPIELMKCDEGYSLTSRSRYKINCNISGLPEKPAVCKPILDKCQGKGSIVLDDCKRRCTCDAKNKPQDCKRVRKAWTDLTTYDKQRYINIVKILATDEEYKPSYELLAREYKELFKKTNIDFLPILNSYYLLVYENLLREFDCRVTIPYWDSYNYESDPFSHPIWDNVNGFGNTSRSGPKCLWDDTSQECDQCVTSGPFNLNEFKLPAEALSDSSFHQPAKLNCLRRQYRRDGTPRVPKLLTMYPFLWQSNETSHKSTNLSSFGLMDPRIPGFSLTTVYDYPLSAAIGGDMVTVNRVYDPIYPLHLAFIDGLFEDMKWNFKKFIESWAKNFRFFVYENLRKGFTFTWDTWEATDDIVYE